MAKKSILRFAVVMFNSDNSALEAIHDLHGKTIKGKKLFVCRFVKQGQKKRNLKRKYISGDSELSVCSNLYVKNLDESVDDLKLFQLFSDFEGILSAKVIYSTSGKSRGFGFVSFSSYEAASKACSGYGEIQLQREREWDPSYIRQTFGFGAQNLENNDEGDGEDIPGQVVNAVMIDGGDNGDIIQGLHVFTQEHEGAELQLVCVLEMLNCNDYEDFGRRLHEAWAKFVDEEPYEVVPLVPLTWPGYNLSFLFFNLTGFEFTHLEPYEVDWGWFRSTIDRVVATPVAGIELVVATPVAGNN